MLCLPRHLSALVYVVGTQSRGAGIDNAADQEGDGDGEGDVARTSIPWGAVRGARNDERRTHREADRRADRVECDEPAIARTCPGVLVRAIERPPRAAYAHKRTAARRQRDRDGCA